jgi:uncharacterized protein YidB (DUF937 family)
MIALLGLLAVAGYQNRDRIKQMLGNIGQNGVGEVEGMLPGAAGTPAAPGGGAPGGGGLGGLLGGLFGGGNASQTLHGGLSDLIAHLTGNGQAAAAQSWVQNGPNREMSTSELAAALGSETLSELSTRTGLSQDDLLARLKSVLPTAVDQMTPQGRLPQASEASDWLRGLAGKAA